MGIKGGKNIRGELATMKCAHTMDQCLHFDRECFTGQKVTNATLGWVGSFLAQSYYRGGGWVGAHI